MSSSPPFSISSGPAPASPASSAPSSTRSGTASPAPASASPAPWPASSPAPGRAPPARAPPRAPPRTRGTAAPIPRRRHGWLAHLLGDDIPAHASQLTHLLRQPGVAAALAASPGAARTLRPLCRMLGADLPPALQPPPPPPRPPRPKAEKPPPEPRQGTPERPLEPYVRRAVRYMKRHGLWRPWQPD